MIIVVHQRAQISNRLVALAALIGHCIRHDIDIVVLSLSEYRALFEPLRHNQRIRLLHVPPSLHRLILSLLQSRLTRPLIRRLSLLHWLGKEQSWAEIDPSQLRSRLWLIVGSGDWCEGMPAIKAPEAQRIRQALSFRSEWLEEAAATSRALKQGWQVLVGVHARRGDYATHRGGRWFYSEADYLRWIAQVPQLFAGIDAERIRFVICSNEAGFLANSGHPSLVASPMGSATGDQALLSCCDLIIGPPSTFSVWAAFLTDTKLLHLFSRDQDLDSSQIRRSTLFYDWRPNREP